MMLDIIKDLPYLKVGAFSYQYGSWSAASDGSTRRKYQQTIFMITDGKPSCVREKMEAMNSNGLDEYIVDKCYSQATSPKIAHSHHNVHDCK
jgi:hypothetical protein